MVRTGIKLNVFAVSLSGIFQNNGKNLIFEAQDVDESYRLSIILFINYVIYLDENIYFSRTLYLLANFNEKINIIDYFKYSNFKEKRKYIY